MMTAQAKPSLTPTTAGPWETFGVDDRILIIGPGREGFCEVRRYYKDGRDEANANLIAAAPEMLRALKAVGSTLAGRDSTRNDDHLWAAFSQCVVAIAKAETAK